MTGASAVNYGGGTAFPVWYCDDCGELTVAREDPTECAHCGSKNIAAGS